MQPDHPLMRWVRDFPWDTSLLVAAGNGEDVADDVADVLAERAATRPPSAESPRVRAYLFYRPDAELTDDEAAKARLSRPAISEHFTVFGLSLALGAQHWKLISPVETCGYVIPAPASSGDEGTVCTGLRAAFGECVRGGHKWQPSGHFVGGNAINLLICAETMGRTSAERAVATWRRLLAPGGRVWLPGSQRPLARALAHSKSAGLHMATEDATDDGFLLRRDD